jgi:hypothetical protein
VALLLYVLIALGAIYALTLIFKALRFVAVTIHRRITARADGYSIDGEWSDRGAHHWIQAPAADRGRAATAG